MKKTKAIILSALFGLICLGASAQCPDNKPCQNACQPQNAGQMNKMRQPREFSEFAFEGILLDVNQQARLDSLNAAVKTNAPQAPQCANADGCPNGDKCFKDSCACGKNCNNCKNAGKCKKNKDNVQECKMNAPQCCNGSEDMQAPTPAPCCKQYIKKVKEILSPEQYTLFLENIVEYQCSRPKGMQGPGPSPKGNCPMGDKMPRGGRHCPLSGQE